MFTDYQVSFYCAGGSCAEGLGEYLTQVEPKIGDFRRPPVILSLPGKYASPSSRTDYHRFSDSVALYSQRALSFERDALHAFRGFMHNMRRSCSTAFTLCGLPFFVIPGQVTYDDWSYKLVQALYWRFLDNHHEPKRRHMFPTWTWAGWQGRIVFYDLPYGPSNFESTIYNMGLGSQAGDTFHPHKLFRQKSHDGFQYALDTITEIHFDAPEIPVENIDVTDYSVRFSLDRTWESHEIGRVAGFGQLLERIQEGTWSCIIMMASEWGRNLTVMIVQWRKDGFSAERVFMLHPYSASTAEENLRPLHEMKRRRVRLI
jgi:hypothetical protein